MSAQNDLQPGNDISALSSVTQLQLMQMISQAAPLVNIGLVIYGATTPDVTNNPRFARYLWIDTSTIDATHQATPKYYNTVTATWNSVTVPSASITGTQLAGHVTALDHMFNAAGVDATLADRVLVYDSSGQFITQITKASLIGSLTVALTQISTSGSAVNQVIKNVAGTVSWANINLASDPLDGTLPLTKLATGIAGFILQMVAGVPTWVSNDDATSNFLPAGTASVGIALSKLKLGNANEIVVMNSAGNAVTYTTQSVRIGSTAVVGTTGIESANDLGTAVHTIAHGLGAKPKLVKAVLICKSGDGGYTAGDEIDASGLETDVFNVCLSVVADATNITILQVNTGAANVRLQNKGTGNRFTPAASANFKPKVYAWL